MAECPALSLYNPVLSGPSFNKKGEVVAEGPLADLSQTLRGPHSLENTSQAREVLKPHPEAPSAK